MELLYGNQRKALKFIYKAYKQKSTTTKVKLSKLLNLNFQETSQVCQELKNKGLAWSVLILIPKLLQMESNIFLLKLEFL